MKNKLLILFLLISIFASAQYPPGYTGINARYDWLAGYFRALNLPAYPTVGLQTGQSTRSGAVLWDSVKQQLRVYNGLASGTWRMYADSVYKINDSTLVVRYGTTKDTLSAFGGGSGGGGSGDMILASAQTNSGIKTFLDGTMKLRNVANTFDGYFVNTNTADRIYTLQNAAGTIAFLSDITGTNSGTNTGDQNLFGSIIVSGQTTVTASANPTALTFVAGSGMTITTDNTAKSITWDATANTDSLFGVQDNSATADRTFNGHDDWLFTFDSIDVQMKRSGVLRFDLNNIATQLYSGDGTNSVGSFNNYSFIDANNTLTYIRAHDDSIAFNQPGGSYSIYALPQRTDTTANKVMTWNSSTKKLGWGNWYGSGGGGGADALGTYIVQTATNAPANAQILASLGTGLVKNTTTTGVLSIAAAGTDYQAPFTGNTEDFTGSTSLTLTLAQNIKAGHYVIVSYNGLELENAAYSFTPGSNTITMSGFSRLSADKIKVFYAY